VDHRHLQTLHSDWLGPERTGCEVPFPGERRYGDLVPAMTRANGDDVDLLASPTGTWSRVSPSLATARRLTLLGWCVVGAVAWGVLAFVLGARVASVFTVIGVAGLAAVAVAAVVVSVVIGRVVAAWGYAITEDILYIRRGRLFRQLLAVPFARLQFVDITAGPLDRRFGLASVRLHTASASSDAHIPGLPSDTARQLRDTLTALSEGRYAGL
jgi:membrane protein YdbS with pleckstrin-like domain